MKKGEGGGGGFSGGLRFFPIEKKGNALSMVNEMHGRGGMSCIANRPVHYQILPQNRGKSKGWEGTPRVSVRGEHHICWWGGGGGGGGCVWGVGGGGGGGVF